jgi:hypothetical protein
MAKRKPVILILGLICTLIVTATYIVCQNSSANYQQNNNASNLQDDTDEDIILGKWLFTGKKGDAVVELEKCGDNLNEYCGTIIEVTVYDEYKDDPVVVENQEKLIGYTFCKGFEFRRFNGKEYQYHNGILYALRTGKAESGIEMKYNLDKPNELSMGKLFFWKTLSKVED